MPVTFRDLIGNTLSRPRIAARQVLSLRLSNMELAQANLLVAVLSVIVQIPLYQVYATQLGYRLHFPLPLPVADVLLYFLSAYLTAYIVVMFARGVGATIDVNKALTLYLWFNFVFIFVLVIQLATLFVMPALGFLFLVAAAIWGIYVIANFWAELLRSDNLLLGVILPVVAIAVSSAISSILASVIRLPVMEIV